MVGVGCFVRTFGNCHGVVMDLPSLQAAGLHEYSDLGKALDHKKYRTWKPTCVQLAKDMVMWVPYGSVALLSSIDEGGGGLMVLPWLSQSLGVQATEELWAFISTSNISFGNKNADKSPWRTLLPALRSFSQSLFS